MKPIIDRQKAPLLIGGGLEYIELLRDTWDNITTQRNGVVSRYRDIPIEVEK